MGCCVCPRCKREINEKYCWNCGVTTVFGEFHQVPTAAQRKVLREAAERQMRYEEHRRKQMYGRRRYAERMASQEPHRDFAQVQYHLGEAMFFLERLGSPESLGARISFFKGLVQLWWTASRLPPEKPGKTLPSESSAS